MEVEIEMPDNPNMLDTQRIIAMTALSGKYDYEMAFADSWSFDFKEKVYWTHPLHEMLSIEPSNYEDDFYNGTHNELNDYNRLLKKFHGIELKPFDYNKDINFLYEYTRKNIPIIISYKSRELPEPYKKQKTGYTYLSIRGIEEDIVYFYDAFTEKYGKLDIHKFKYGIRQSWILEKSKESKKESEDALFYAYKKTCQLKESKAFMKMRQFADFMESRYAYFIQFEEERSYNKTYRFLAAICRGRGLFAFVFRFLANQYGLLALNDFAERIELIAKKWISIRALIHNMTCKWEKNQASRKRINRLINQCADMEEALANDFIFLFENIQSSSKSLIQNEIKYD